MEELYKDRLKSLRDIIHKYISNNLPVPNTITIEYNSLLELCVEIENKKEKAFIIANNAIYFNDRSDYLSALYDVCKALNPKLDESLIGSKYIDDIY